MINVALVDDHVIVRSGFAQLLSLEADITVVGEFNSAAEARLGLPSCHPDVVILDISMQDESGLSLLEEIPSGIASIMLSVHDSPAMVEKSLELGAKGYLSKRCSPDELIQAVHTSANGGCYLTPDIAIKLATPLKNKASLNQLTRRESEVCQLLATGLDVKSIAVELGVSHKTVHVHRANAMDKLNVKNNVELAKLFTQDQY
ncbi:two-component system uhpT operon response regulator UhpA [Vibrio crassostreae]|uniref:transcriptional regulator UhpA n=1 Tax=Vibrio crassostreae TaxID=246167 RepID=UPI000F49AB23|nr:transcriptional regulator UhpA [Vibrio crassostreae]ROO72280.1 two-component system uhpT operon response regulator UhpA [Vibrio crassostreae]ROP10588.1 two-component system uhpT operon response regulator UhpA [Vibrio crassostreae]ROQ80258.1 two-component system uhpT operon response regulator UhpA [Vibrio crassostreae]ROR85428.1 two-component system uhpT operon response regulator UhpA [Vibrio crassostreae]RPE93349.1 two-component system uhpT operon response regulator UhpA [Vibrio crassostrea